MDNPPDVNVAICAGFTVTGKQGDVFGHQQSQVGCCGHPHCVCKRGGAKLKNLLKNWKLWDWETNTSHYFLQSFLTYWWRFSRSEGPHFASRHEAIPSPQCWVSFLPGHWTESCDWFLHVASGPQCTDRSPSHAPYPSGASESKMKEECNFLYKPSQTLAWHSVMWKVTIATL